MRLRAPRFVVGASLMLVALGCHGSAGSGSGGATTSASISGSGSTSESASQTVASSASGAVDGCNPVLDTQCKTMQGEACDYSGDGTSFRCWGSPSATADLCAMCSNQGAGPACKDGSTCLPADGSGVTHQCARFCCSDADCGGAVASCALDGKTVGVCGTDGIPLGTTAATGTGGAGGSAYQQFFIPQCAGIPVLPPSGGRCGAH